MILVDANVRIDVLHGDPEWFGWSSAQIDTYAELGIAINPIIYAEVAMGFPDSESCDQALTDDVVRLDLPWEAALAAGRAFLAYRERGGTRSASFPDFFIGAHAAVSGLTLITRDARRYRIYFPDLQIIAPA